MFIEHETFIEREEQSWVVGPDIYQAWERMAQARNEAKTKHVLPRAGHLH